MKIQMKTEPKTAVVYTSWNTEVLPHGAKIKNEEDAKPILALFQSKPSNIEIKGFYVDAHKDHTLPKFQALLDDCGKNKYDYVLIPSLNSLTPNLLNIRSMIEKIKMKSPFTEVYFDLEEIYTGSEDWEIMISFLLTIREETRLLAQRKQELSAIILRRPIR